MRCRKYVPLWCKTNYSFLEGASHPEELVETCSRYHIPAIAITDRDGVYGIVRAHMEAKERGVKLIIGSELTITTGSNTNESHTGTSHTGTSHTGMSRIILLAQNKYGYMNLCKLVTAG